MQPLRCGIVADQRAVNEALREIQHIAVLVLAGWHDARGHIRQVHIVGNAGQVLAFPDLHVGIAAHAVHEEHIEPIPGQLAAVFGDKTLIAEEGLHGVDIGKLHFFSLGGHVRIKGEVMLRQAMAGDALNHRCRCVILAWRIALYHVVHEVIEHMAGIHRNLVQVRNDAINAEGLVPQLPRLDYFLCSLLWRGQGPDISQIACGHIPVLAIRTGDFIPAGRGLREDNYLRALLVLSENLVFRTGAGAKP